MKRILVVDDNRIISFNPAYIGPNKIEYARTVDEGIRMIHKGPWDAVFLDHDMGLYEDCGCEMVKHILEHDDLDVTKFYVHTMNMVAGDRMADSIHQHSDYDVQRVDLYDFRNKRFFGMATLPANALRDPSKPIRGSWSKIKGCRSTSIKGDA